MVTAEQRCRDLRTRGRPQGERSLTILGMEVARGLNNVGHEPSASSNRDWGDHWRRGVGALDGPHPSLEEDIAISTNRKTATVPEEFYRFIWTAQKRDADCAWWRLTKIGRASRRYASPLDVGWQFGRALHRPCRHRSRTFSGRRSIRHEWS